LQSSFAASAAFAGALSALSSRAERVVAESDGTSGPAPLRLERFIYDERFAEAAAAARRAAAHGAALAATTGDVTSLWYDDLDLRWRRAPMTLGGVTTRGALFVLETLAADRGMRVLYRGEHDVASRDGVTHALAGPESVLGAIARSNESWPLALGRALAACATSTAPGSGAGFGRFSWRSPADTAGAAPNGPRAEPLHSWIIAPRSAVGTLA
jgi:hypothetical protein